MPEVTARQNVRRAHAHRLRNGDGSGSGQPTGQLMCQPTGQAPVDESSSRISDDDDDDDDDVLYSNV